MGILKEKPMRYCERHKTRYFKGESCPRCKLETEANTFMVSLADHVIVKLDAIVRGKGLRTRNEAIEEAIMSY